MVKRRAKAAGLQGDKMYNHSSKGTENTNYVTNGSWLDVAHEWANHSESITTGLYDHSAEKVSLVEVKRI